MATLLIMLTLAVGYTEFYSRRHDIIYEHVLIDTDLPVARNAQGGYAGGQWDVHINGYLYGWRGPPTIDKLDHANSNVIATQTMPGAMACFTVAPSRLIHMTTERPAFF